MGNMETSSKSTTFTSTAEEDATLMLRALMQTLETIPVNDGTFTLKSPFVSIKTDNKATDLTNQVTEIGRTFEEINHKCYTNGA
jgi:hypothetical protein